MKTEQIKQLYDSPMVKVVEIKPRRAILAASAPNSTAPYEREEW